MAASTQEIVSPIRAGRPELTLSAASINAEPVELDSTPASPDKVRARRASRDEALAELGGEQKEKREQLLSERKTDPAVLVDIPQTPGADELEKGAKILDKNDALSPTQYGQGTSNDGIKGCVEH